MWWVRTEAVRGGPRRTKQQQQIFAEFRITTSLSPSAPESQADSAHMKKSHGSSRTYALSTLATVLAALVSAPAQAWVPGKDGALTVGAANTVINQYTTLAAGAGAGSTTLSLSSAAGITPGDVLLVYQAQGATVSAVNSNAYGAVTSLGNAGRYEFVSVSAVSGGTVTLGTACDSTPLRFSYNSGAQVVRVPQYSTLTVNAGGSIVTPAWNGSTGGVVAAIVQNTAVVNGSISASALGFRGGAIDNDTTATGTDVTLFSSAASTAGAEKGESIAGYQAQYDASAGGRYGRGAPANGGGGGNAHNAGGGGGGNGGSALGWSGQGIPDASVAAWATAWNLDGTLTATTNSPGGGRGGYTFSSSNQDALTLAPGTAAWGGNQRRERGGLGGRPLANSAGTAGDTRLFFGGGGGAGDANNNAAGAGGRGGGLVALIAGAVSGSGSLTANGGNGASTVPGHNDAPGGAGGGGAILLAAPSAGGVSLSATGGNGGSQLIGNAEAEGPGGGGGGGFIAAPAGAGAVTGGANGTTTSTSLTEFLPNGATRGNAGNSATAPALGQLPVCTLSNIADYGDAPDAGAGTATGNYSTLAGDNGPTHALAAVPTIYLGATAPDADDGSLQNAAATADDGSGVDDEDDIPGLPAVFVKGQAYTIPITVAGTGFLNAWADWNRDGDFTDAGEQIATGVARTSGTANLSATVPAGASTGVTYARFRYSSTQTLASTGAASDGEVEDYAINIAATVALTFTKTNTPGVNGNVDQATDTVVSGAATTYSLVVTNTGPDAANGTVLRDPAATGLTCATATCSATGAATCPAATGAALVAELQSAAGAAIPALPVGGSLTFTLTCTVQ